jgi:hypothetical protein
METRKRTKGQTLHRELKIEQHGPHKKPGVNSASLVAPAVLLLVTNP